MYLRPSNDTTSSIATDQGSYFKQFTVAYMTIILQNPSGLYRGLTGKSNGGMKKNTFAPYPHLLGPYTNLPYPIHLSAILFFL